MTNNFNYEGLDFYEGYLFQYQTFTELIATFRGKSPLEMVKV